MGCWNSFANNLLAGCLPAVANLVMTERMCQNVNHISEYIEVQDQRHRLITIANHDFSRLTCPIPLTL